VAEKRALADTLRADAALFARTQQEAADKLATMPASSKGVKTKRSSALPWVGGAAAAAAAGVGALLLSRRRK
jgi:hypothetical protein